MFQVLKSGAMHKYISVTVTFLCYFPNLISLKPVERGENKTTYPLSLALYDRTGFDDVDFTRPYSVAGLLIPAVIKFLSLCNSFCFDESKCCIKLNKKARFTTQPGIDVSLCK